MAKEASIRPDSLDSKDFLSKIEAEKQEIIIEPQFSETKVEKNVVNETQKIVLSDFQTNHNINQNTKTLESLPEDSKLLANPKGIIKSYLPVVAATDPEKFDSYKKLCLSHVEEYQKHLKGDTPLVCLVCHSPCLHWNTLQRHLQTHIDFRPFVCSFCQRTFYSQSKLKRHQGTHSEVKPYECPLCQRRLGRTEHLKRHLLVHTDTKPFACSGCTHTTKRLDGIRRHIKRKHGTDGAKVIQLELPLETLTTTENSQEMHSKLNEIKEKQENKEVQIFNLQSNTSIISSSTISFSSSSSLSTSSFENSTFPQSLLSSPSQNNNVEKNITNITSTPIILNNLKNCTEASISQSSDNKFKQSNSKSRGDASKKQETNLKSLSPISSPNSSNNNENINNNVKNTNISSTSNSIECTTDSSGLVANSNDASSSIYVNSQKNRHPKSNNLSEENNKNIIEEKNNNNIKDNNNNKIHTNSNKNKNPIANNLTTHYNNYNNNIINNKQNNRNYNGIHNRHHHGNQHHIINNHPETKNLTSNNILNNNRKSNNFPFTPPFSSHSFPPSISSHPPPPHPSHHHHHFPPFPPQMLTHYFQNSPSIWSFHPHPHNYHSF